MIFHLDISLKWDFNSSSRVFWRICFLTSETFPREDTGMTIVSGLSDWPKSKVVSTIKDENKGSRDLIGSQITSEPDSVQERI